MARLEGTQLGNYELLELIGTGGMAEVYRAHQLHAFGREVAVKVIKHSIAEQPLFYERFLREAQATARLSHPHILPLIELGAVGRKRQLFFLVMPYIPDGTLRDLLARMGGPLPVEVIAPLFIQLCEAVQYAHDQGLVHRDIKPSNILLQREQYVLLGDFGIALDVEDMRLTNTGVGLGTPEYTSPEQAQGIVDKRGDIYSMGIVLFELLTGQVPYMGRTPYQVFYKQTTSPIPSLRSVHPAALESLTRFDLVIQQALAKEPLERFQTASAFSDAFQAALSTAAVAAAPLPAEMESGESTPAPAPALLATRATEVRPNEGVQTRPDEDPIGERPTSPASQPVMVGGLPGRYFPAERPAPPRRSKAPILLLSLLALLVLGGATLALTASMFNGLGANSLNRPHVISTSSPQTQNTTTPLPTHTPHARPTTSPTSAPTPTSTPSPTPSPSPTPTTPPQPTATP